MPLFVRQMLLGLVLIVLASSVLLLSDLDRRKVRLLGAPRVALLQYASQPAIDESVSGMIDGLAEAGFIDGESIAIQRYQADIETRVAEAERQLQEFIDEATALNDAATGEQALTPTPVPADN